MASNISVTQNENIQVKRPASYTWLYKSHFTNLFVKSHKA